MTWAQMTLMKVEIADKLNPSNNFVLEKFNIVSHLQVHLILEICSRKSTVLLIVVMEEDLMELH